MSGWQKIIFLLCASALGWLVIVGGFWVVIWVLK